MVWNQSKGFYVYTDKQGLMLNGSIRFCICQIWPIGGKMKVLLALSMGVLILSGCASNSGVVPNGDDTFMVSRQAATGFSGLGTLKADAIQEANQYCLQQDKTLHVISATEAEPPFILGNFPKADVKFSCVDIAANSRDVSDSSDDQKQTENRESIYADLERLNDLRERGILTDAEFDAEKKKLLDAE